jgi:threonine synthase
MDVGYPSNFSRIKDLYANSLDSLKEDVIGFTYSDEQTRKIIYQVYRDTGYILDPHGAIGYMGLSEFMNSHNGLVGAFLGTAHPAKFLDVVHPLVSGRVEIPSRLQQVLERPKHAVELSSDYPEFKQYLLSN